MWVHQLDQTGITPVEFDNSRHGAEVGWGEEGIEPLAKNDTSRWNIFTSHSVNFCDRCRGDRFSVRSERSVLTRRGARLSWVKERKITGGTFPFFTFCLCFLYLSKRTLRELVKHSSLMYIFLLSMLSAGRSRRRRCSI